MISHTSLDEARKRPHRAMGTQGVKSMTRSARDWPFPSKALVAQSDTPFERSAMNHTKGRQVGSRSRLRLQALRRRYWLKRHGYSTNDCCYSSISGQCNRHGILILTLVFEAQSIDQAGMFGLGVLVGAEVKHRNLSRALAAFLP